ncbi:MAG: alpha/beta fold hydrolase [Vicinamibacterales bacterium]
MLNDAGEWALIAGNLSGRLVIPDWPGCGLSDAVRIRPVGFRRFGVAWLTGLVDALGAGQVDIVGSSMGGCNYRSVDGVCGAPTCQCGVRAEDRKRARRRRQQLRRPASGCLRHGRPSADRPREHR